MLRDLERTPILSPDGLVLSKKSRRELRRLAQKLGPLANVVETRWRKRLPAALGETPQESTLRALRAINAGAGVDALASGRLQDFFENVEYHSRRLAKLDVAPARALGSLKEYRSVLVRALRRIAGEEMAELEIALDRLHFAIELTVNDAYYQVRDSEAAAFYDVLQDQLETLGTKDLMNRVLDTLIRTFRADGGVIVLLPAAESDELTIQAWKGMRKPVARGFAGKVGEGLIGEVAGSGTPEAVADIRHDERPGSSKIAKSFQSVWAVPLTVRGKVTGVAALAFEREYFCLPREMKLFEAIAERCALAIDKAQLLEELRQREERIRQLGEHMLNVEEEERRRISRELHDEVGQSLLVVRLSLEMIQSTLDEKSEPHEKLGETRKVVEDVIVEMRRLISALSPSTLQMLGLPAGIRQFVKNLGHTFPGRVKMRMTDVEDLPEGSKTMMYRLVQECMTNAVKHSAASNVSLQLSQRSGAVRMKMQDDGVGFDLAEANRKRESFGLAGMRERVALLGGDIDIQSAPGKGTRVSIAIPV